MSQQLQGHDSPVCTGWKQRASPSPGLGPEVPLKQQSVHGAGGGLPQRASAHTTRVVPNTTARQSGHRVEGHTQVPPQAYTCCHVKKSKRWGGRERDTISFPPGWPQALVSTWQRCFPERLSRGPWSVWLVLPARSLATASPAGPVGLDSGRSLPRGPGIMAGNTPSVVAPAESPSTQAREC